MARGDEAICLVATFMLTSLATTYDRVYNTLITAGTQRITMDNIDNHTPYTPAPTAAQALVVDGLPPCTIQPSGEGTWHVTTQLAADEQDALATATPSPDVLCQRAQHALGLAGIGSRIAPDRNAIGVYLPTSPASFGTTPLILEGRPLLWTVSRASSETVQALVAAALHVMGSAPTPLRTTRREG
jgi:hypothetical protein